MMRSCSSIIASSVRKCKKSSSDDDAEDGLVPKLELGDITLFERTDDGDLKPFSPSSDEEDAVVVQVAAAHEEEAEPVKDEKRDFVLTSLATERRVSCRLYDRCFVGFFRSTASR